MTHPLNPDFITRVLEQSNRDDLDRDNQHNMSVTEIRCECPSCCLTEANKNNISSDSSTNGMSPASQGTQQSIDGILSGYQWNIALGGTITYSFYEDDDFTNSYYGSEKNVKEVSKEVQDSYREIFAWLENVIDVDFVEVDETDPNTFGQIRIMNSDGPSYAYAYYPFSSRNELSGDIHLNSSFDRFGDTNGFKHYAGKHGYMTLVHELGHALGLAHPHSGTVLPSDLDNTDNSIMSYNFTGNSAATFARLDILALQHLYGTKEHNTGDTIYVFGEYIDQVSVNGVSLVDTPHRTKQTLWDSGGIDTLDFSNLRSQNSGFHLDLRDGGFLSKTFSGTTNYSTSLAYNVDIENAINSSSNDTIYLNDVANEISGYHENRFTGHDVIHYGSSQDIIRLDYFSHQVTETRSGQDLVLGLGSNGSIRLVNYYGSSNTQIQVVYNDGNLIAPITQSNFSISVTVKGVAYDATVASYGNESINNGNPAPQDIGDAVVTTSEDGNEVQIINNGWKSVDIGDYNLTDNTVITFEFRSDYQGELQGIGLDNNDNVFDSTNALFQLYGTQVYANQAFNNYTYSGDGWQQYSINVGELLGGSGTYDRLVFMNDDDANPFGVSSQFRNVEIFENLPFKVTVDGVNQTPIIESYGNDSILNGNSRPQDTDDAVVTTSENGNEVQIINNGWKSVDIGDYHLTDNTIITFEFRSDYQGELQGIGLDNNDNVFDSTNALFQLYGTEVYTNQAFNNYTYSGDGWQQYSINVGELLGGSGTYDRLVFMNDDDANPLGVSSQFRNIAIVEQNNNNITVEDNALTVTVETITQISTLQSYGNDSVLNGKPLPQDTDDAVVTTSEDGNEVQIINNGWKSVDIGNYNLTDNTVITLEFRSDYQGELQGIGLDNNDNVFDSTNALFQLYGTQTFANQTFNNYTYSDDGWQQYSINVGKLLGGSGTYDRLVFMNDDDTNPLGVSSQFRNIVISETAVNHVPGDSITVETDRTILNLMSQKMGIDLTGINQDRPLLGEKGTSGADTFVLGDQTRTYYNQNGYDDLTLIEGFNNQQGDSLQLHGEAGLYNVVTVEHRGMSANAIFYQEGNREDLMAIVTGDRIDLQSSAVKFV